MIRAVVQRALGEAPEVREVELRAPEPHQVRVRISAAGVCHTDLSISTGVIRQQFPAVLGHEGAGTVVEVGDDVTSVRPGDRVVLNWSPACRHCWHCLHGEPELCEHSTDAWATPYGTLDGEPLYSSLGTGAFAQETVVDARAVVGLPGLSDSAALLGCAVLTGVGAVVNTARVQPGESVAVFGLGGVGLSAVQGARLAGASPIVAVDVSPAKEELALRAGATHFLPAGEGIAKEIRKLTGRGVDHAFECVGRGSVARDAWRSTRRGGRTTIVGVGGRDDTVTFNSLELFHYARTIGVSTFGSSDPDRDVPRFAALAAAGRLDLDALVTARLGLDGVPRAFEEMRAGTGARTLIVP